MSTVRITITTQPKDGGQVNYGTVNLRLTIGAQEYSLALALSPSSGYLRFQEVLWQSPGGVTDNQQALNYRNAFNRDHSNAGGTRNLTALLVGNEVTVTSREGTFSNGGYTGNILGSVSFVYNNSPQTVPKMFNFEATGTGGCTTEQYRVLTATGGVAPYSLSFAGVAVVSGWDGVTATTFNLNRASVYNGGLYDSTGALIRSVSINPTKNISPADFGQQTVPYTGYADLVVPTLVPRAGTGPLAYNLVGPGVLETGWVAQNVFGGISPGTYTLKVRDRYLCEVSKVISVKDITVPEQGQREPYFEVSDYNSLSFFNEVVHSDSVRKSYDNTPSWDENVGLPRNGVFEFPATSSIPTQFRSSFPFHRINLYRRGLPPIALQPFEIQTNLGVSEKVDCKMFLLFSTLNVIGGGTVTLSTGTGIYFEGGSNYVPGSGTLATDPDSPYNGNLPPWAVVGNFVAVDGKGVFEIVETDIFDEDRQVLYFRIAEKFPDQDAVIQSSFDRHPYNVFRFTIDMANIFDKGAFVRIEPGIMDGQDFLVDTTRIFRSEWIVRLMDTSKFVKVQWFAFRNIGRMMFTDGTVCEMWVKGRIRPFSESDAETDETDRATLSVDQSSYLRMRGFFPLMPPRKWRKLDLVSAIGNRGSVTVEGMEVVRMSATEQEEQGTTNLSNITIEFAFASEGTSVGQEDPIYSVDTGLTVNPGSSPSSGKGGVLAWELTGDQKRLTTEDGDFVKVVDSDGTEKYIIVE